MVGVGEGSKERGRFLNRRKTEGTEVDRSRGRRSEIRPRSVNESAGRIASRIADSQSPIAVSRLLSLSDTSEGERNEEFFQRRGIGFE